MRKWLVAIGSILFVAGYIFYFRWSSAIHQPLDFSHAEHVRSEISCKTCHGSVPDNLPVVQSCKSCHTEIAFPAAVQWIRIYRIAPDIIFSHADHGKADCSVCHLEMTSAKRFLQERRFPMVFCMDCHKQQGAPNRCGDCHKNR